MNCKKCGKELQPEEKICSSCGENQEEENTENVLSAETAEKPQEEILAEDKKTKRRFFKVQNVVIAVMAVIIVAMGSYITLNIIRGGLSETSQTNSNLFDKNNLIAARIGETWGFIDKTGKWVINPQFQKVKSFAENGLCAVQLPDGEKSGKWGYINKKGEYVISPNYADVDVFSKNGLVAVKEYKEDGKGKWGYIDTKAAQIIPFQFDKASAFDDKEQAIVSLGGKFGIIDKKGSYVINPQFDDLNNYSDYSEKLLAFELNGKDGYADNKGNYIVQPDYISLSRIYEDGYIIYVNEQEGHKKVGIMDRSGAKLFENTFDGISFVTVDDFCKQEGCSERTYSGDYCSEHKPKTTSSTSSYLPYCDAYGCLNKVPYSWRKYCDKHSYLEY